MLKLEFVDVLAAEIIHVLDSIAWVRCASGNVYILRRQVSYMHNTCYKNQPGSLTQYLSLFFVIYLLHRSPRKARAT